MSESFKDLFSRGEIPVSRSRRVSVGDEVEGVVGHVGKDEVFVDLDEKQQAYFDVIDLRGPDGQLSVKDGDRLKGYVISVEGDQIRLGRRLGRELQSTDHLRAAFEGSVPVEGKVSGANKGGVEVDLGGVRGFCPFSQLDSQRVEDGKDWIGRTESFLITKIEDRDVVVSRRALLDRESRAAREELLSTLKVGTIVQGRVSGIRDFGVFVDLGGIEGLIPSRELSHDRVRPEDVVQLGNVVEAEVRSIEEKTFPNKPPKTEISLSLRSLASDPWEGIETLAPVGRVVAGQVSRLAEFGAFIRIAPGVEGLMHISELGARVRHPEEVLQVGQSMLARVVSVDTVRKRLGLAPASEGAAAGAQDSAGSVVLGAVVPCLVEKVEGWGLVVQIEGISGRAGRGGIPNAETNTRQGADLRREFPVGTRVNAKVIEAIERRVRLSIRAAFEDAERAEFDGYKHRSAEKGRMGTFGDLLKAKLSK